jgi:nitrate reductase (NAD(P)H)
MQDPQDPTSCVVLFGNRQEEDILCRAELDAFEASDKIKCTIVHTLSKAPDTWAGRRGRIGEALLKEFAAPDDESMVLICGPEAMENSAKTILLAQGWKESNLHFF